MRVIIPFISRPSGSVLVITLATGILLASILIGYLGLTDNLSIQSARSQAWNVALAVAEAGIEEGLTQISFTNYLASNGWTLSNGQYVKSRTFDGNSYTVVITNPAAPVLYATGYVSSSAFANPIARQITVTTRRDGLFTKGLAAKGVITLGGGVRADSFNSTDTNFSTGGRYDPAKFKDNGDIATDSELISAITGNGGVTIFGHVSTGPGGTLSLGGQAVAGSKSYIQEGGAGIQPGWSSDDMNVNFSNVSPPFAGGAFTPGSGSYGDTNYTYLVGNGNYQMDSLSLSGQQMVAVTGNAVLYVTGNISLSGQAMIYIAPGASLQLYCAGADASLTGQGVVNSSGSATNFCYYGLPSNTSLNLGGNAAFTGVVYAPGAAFTMSGGGNDAFDFAGAAVVKTANMHGHYNFHYDENIGNNGPSRGFIVTSWNEF